MAEGETIFSDSWAKLAKSNRRISYAAKYAKKLGYPVIVKPNSKNQGTDKSQHQQPAIGFYETNQSFENLEINFGLFRHGTKLPNLKRVPKLLVYFLIF